MKKKTIRVECLGHSSILIDFGSSKMFIDPYNIPDVFKKKADAILVSHDHYDHFSPKDIDNIARNDCIVVGNSTISEKVESNFVSLTPGKKRSIRLDCFMIDIFGIPAYNLTKSFHKKSSAYLGFLILVYMDNNKILTVYYAGDTDKTEDVCNISNVDVLILPIGGKYTMDLKEALEVSGTILPKVTIPCHFNTSIVGCKADTLPKFTAEAEKLGLHVSYPSEIFTFDHKELQDLGKKRKSRETTKEED